VKTKEEVLAAQIEIYRQIFTISMTNAKKLDAATRHFLEVINVRNISYSVPAFLGLQIGKQPKR
jgi:hypothetical protein